MLQEKVSGVRVFVVLLFCTFRIIFKYLCLCLCLSPAPPEVLLRGRAEARRAGPAAARHHERHLQQEHQRSGRKGLTQNFIQTVYVRKGLQKVRCDGRRREMSGRL